MDKKLLIIIDMQEGFRYEKTESIIHSVIEKIKEFGCENVAFTQFYDEKDSLFEKQLQWPKFQALENQKILREFDQYVLNIFRHKTYSILNEGLLNFINKNSYRKIYLTGIYTDVSILVTAMQLFDLGFEVFIFSECCQSVHQFQEMNLHKAGIESLSHILGKDHIL